MNKLDQFLSFVNESFDVNDLETLQKSMQQLKDSCDDDESKKKYALLEEILTTIDSGNQVQEVIRNAIYEEVKVSIQESNTFSDIHESNIDQVDIIDAIESKRDELRHMLDHMDEHMKDRSMDDAVSFFSSLLEIVSQICVQQTEGVITVRTVLYQFLDVSDDDLENNRDLHREISIIFTPEEIRAIQKRLGSLPNNDFMKPVFANILDQASDTLRFNELSGHLLLYMTKYFIDKLTEYRYEDVSLLQEFQRRHERSESALQTAVANLRDLEAVIHQHMTERPILKEFPKYLRGLIKVKLGLMDQKIVPEIKKLIAQNNHEYARARSATAFDFNKFPDMQHGLRLKQRFILNLQKDIMKVLQETLKNEFNALQDELQRILDDIETSSEHLDPRSTEYKVKLEKKMQLQKKVEESRRRLDVLHCQQSVVDAQQTLMADAIKRHNENKKYYVALEEKLQTLQSQKKLKQQTTKPKEIKPAKKVQRMVTAQKHNK